MNIQYIIIKRMNKKREYKKVPPSINQSIAKQTIHPSHHHHKKRKENAH